MDEQPIRQETAVLKLELDSQAVVALLEALVALHKSVAAIRADVAALRRLQQDLGRAAGGLI